MVNALQIAPAFVLTLISAVSAQDVAKCSDVYSESCYKASNIIEKDVAIIGGGSSGTYAAITIKDAGKSLVVIEKQDRLGGHVQTYIDPPSGKALNYGVRLFGNSSTTYQFFTRVGATMVPFQPAGPATSYYDFVTGQPVPGFAPNRNYTAYKTQSDKYPYLEAGNGYPLPSPPPSDLSLSFNDFVVKYNLSSFAYAAWANPSLGDLGDTLKIPALYILKGLTTTVLTQEGVPGTTLVSADGNNNSPFAKARTILGSSVLLNSTVVSSKRPANGSKNWTYLVIQTPSGKKLIKAKKVLFTAAESLDNLKPFSLDSTETNIFSRLNYTGFYSGLVSNTPLSANITYQNAAGTKASNPYQIPNSPNTMHFYQGEVPGYQSWWYMSYEPVSETKVRSDVLAAIAKLTGASTANVKFPAFANNSPGVLWAPPKQIQAGFWDKLNKLQGYRNLYYTGLLFEPSAAGLWEFTRKLIIQMNL